MDAGSLGHIKKLATEPWVCAGHWHFQEAHCSKNVSHSATEIEVRERGCAGLACGLQNYKKNHSCIKNRAEMEKHRRSACVCLVQSLLVSQYTGGLTAIMLFLCCKYAYNLLWGTQFTWAVNACFIASQIDV